MKVILEPFRFHFLKSFFAICKEWNDISETKRFFFPPSIRFPANSKEWNNINEWKKRFFFFTINPVSDSLNCSNGENEWSITFKDFIIFSSYLRNFFAYLNCGIFKEKLNLIFEILNSNFYLKIIFNIFVWLTTRLLMKSKYLLLKE